MIMVQTNILVLVRNTLFQLTNAFGKDLEDIKSCGVQTCSQTTNEPTVSNQEYRHYFQNKKGIRHWIFGTETYTINKSDRFYVV